MNILITRPIDQAKILAEKLKLLQFKPVIFPTIEIQPVKFNHPDLNNINILIFVSPAAIYSFSQQIQQLPADIQIFTMGEDSAKIINNLNLNWPNPIYPKNYFNREELLKLPELQNLTHKNILIITSKANINLTETLKSRGGSVHNLITYQSLLPSPHSKPDLKNIDLVISTSQTGLKNLVVLLGPEIKSKPLLVSSIKLVQLAHQLGFIHPPLMAKNAGDQALIEALPIRP